MKTPNLPLPNQWVLVLSEYEAVNLAAVLEGINKEGGQFNTGDWVNQVRDKLPHPIEGLRPNVSWHDE
jgi:hypothetical protein